MEKQLEKAFKNVLEDPKTVDFLAKALAKQVVKEKSTPSNAEEELVKEHIVFGVEGSDTAKFMTTKEIIEEIHGFKPDINIRPRIFGKACIAEAQKTKDSAAGRVYLVEAVVKEITPELLDEITHKTNGDGENKDAKEIEVDFENVQKLTIADLNDMGVAELLEVLEAAPFKIKKAKKMDADELRAKLIEALDLENEQEEEEEAIPVDLDLLAEAVSDYDSVEDYKEHLESFSKSKLIKHINKYKMPIVCEDKTEEEIVFSIIQLVLANIEQEEEEEEQPEPAKKTVVKKKKKDKKKDKKDKKKKKKKKKSKE